MKATTYKNYNRFRPHLIHLSDFPGPAVGDKLIDVEVFDLEGNKVKLSSFIGKPIILEMGSYTCPMYCKSVNPMTQLAKKYPDFHFLVLYIREAHPGELTKGHVSIDKKIELAKRIAKDDSVRKVLVDDIEGVGHDTYGAMPNSIHIFDGNGIVTYRSDWSHPPIVTKVLESMTKKEVRFERDHFEKVPPIFSLSILLRGGWLAIFDVIVYAPIMFYEHIKARLSFGSSRTLTKKSIKDFS